MRPSKALAAAFFFALILALPARADLILFDATRHEQGGNADWVIDADAWNLSMQAYPCTGSTNESNPVRYPTPAQSGITPTTAETYWTGGISAWAVDLVKAGHTVESLPWGAAITFGDGGNPQDLSNYDLFIVVEPQNPFTAAEKTAILAFVNAGGGLFMVGDHETSDRDCDGWDSPRVWNDLTGATSTTATGIFGIWMRVDGIENKGSEDWFDDGIDSNVETNPADPIIYGPFGSGAGGIGFFGATSMDINPADNPTVLAHVWRTGQTHNNLRVTFATASYGSGRVAAIGDSSPADDETGDAGDSLYPGWDKATGGVKNKEIHLNACAWLLNPIPDTTPPVITGGPSAGTADCSATITWTTDEASTSVVQYGLTAGYGSTASTAGYTQAHTVSLSPLVPGTLYHYRVGSSDTVGNGPTWSGDATFTTAAASAPLITVGPSVTGITGTAATIVWTTNETSTSQVDYGTSASYGSSASSAGYSAAHSVALTGLIPTTTYHYSALSSDPCGNGPTASTDATFTTGPASTDVSGWILKQFNGTLTYTIPAGTTIPSGGYLVVARNATRAQFEAAFPSMPAETVFLNSNALGSCADGCMPQVNGAETFELFNGAVMEDGTTIAMATGNSYQRNNPGDPAGGASSWTTVPRASANPGQGAGASTGAGVVINEMADADTFTNEFVELYNDSGAVPVDTTPPAAISNLLATPLSTTSIRLNWTATGDDGTVGTAASSVIKMSPSRILSEADFTSAASVTGVPSPLVAGTAQQVTVTGLTADTAYYFAMKVSDEVPNTSGLSNLASGVTAYTGGGGSFANHLVISQVQTNGDGTTPADDEFIELYNPTASAVSLTGKSLQYKSATGTTYTRLNLSAGSVPSYGYFLIARSAYNGSPAADVTNGAFLMAAAGGNIYLVGDQVTLTSCTQASVVDRLAFGTGNCPEGTAASAPSANNSIVRKPGDATGSGTDSDVNSADFQAQSPSVPHNSSSTPATPGGAALGNVRATLFLTPGASGTELDWADAAVATGYLVYRGTTGDFMAGSPAATFTPTPSITLDALPPTPVLYYVVLATDGVTISTD